MSKQHNILNEIINRMNDDDDNDDDDDDERKENKLII
jgi:hypothetical protein